MLPLQYLTVGWPATAASYEIEFWDVARGTVKLVREALREAQYTHAYQPDDSGLLLVYPMRPSGRAKPYSFPINEVPSLATLRWMVRAAVNDTLVLENVDMAYPEAPKWPDSEIDTYLREAIGLLNNFNQQDVVIETTGELLRPEVVRRLSQITQVAYYDDRANTWIVLSRFSRRGPEGPSHSWDLVNGQLVLNGRLPRDLRLQISGLAPFPVPINDLQRLLVERDDWDLLSIYAQGRCYLRLAGQSAQLDRWKEEGKRNDNPITPVARLLMQDATNRMKDRRGPRSIRRYRA